MSLTPQSRVYLQDTWFCLQSKEAAGTMEARPMSRDRQALVARRNANHSNIACSTKSTFLHLNLDDA
ncbi:uncharacterized protein N7482_006501 [Penicillium canariense]|uniref:Uncharacterized protein n=1 Tax=Penicillium canariense TaxID=189055 RepID=A0A9W9LI83_9EURO|nr:uncharacterized protein N7482_006501 [Penicillium canariense]KAJ5159497.1 hypothetical protein N7482_006501 [Penicillium canariense]